MWPKFCITVHVILCHENCQRLNWPHLLAAVADGFQNQFAKSSPDLLHGLIAPVVETV